MTPEQKRAMQDAATAIASIPHYSGMALVVFTKNFSDVQMAKHGVRDGLIDQALLSLIDQRQLKRPSIIVPGSG